MLHGDQIQCRYLDIRSKLHKVPNEFSSVRCFFVILWACLYVGVWQQCFLWAVNLCSNPDDKLQIYRDNFEKAYMDSTERFYRTQAPAYLQQNGVQNYMKYVSKGCF